MDATGWLILVAVVVVLAVAGLAAWRWTRQRSLRQRFGPEYDRTVDLTGDRKDAERELRNREKARSELEIRPLAPDARQRYADEWTRTQADFVETPVAAIRQADMLVVRVMRDRGYPVDDYDAQTGAISVDHPGVVENYRAAHDISRRTEDSKVSTEDLRRAMLHFRTLFDELLDERANAGRTADR
jgi:hypothetical protein